MKHLSLGDLDVSPLGLGCMGMSAYYTGAGLDDAGAIRTIRRALDLAIRKPLVRCRRAPLDARKAKNLTRTR
jgi:hypothetical protein